MFKLSVFRHDITPPTGHPLCAAWYPPCRGVADRIFASGVVLQPASAAPIVLCALDWAELSNGEHALWRERLAAAVGTTAERVAVHCTHTHDSPWPDRDAQDILDAHGKHDVIMFRSWCDAVLAEVAAAAAASLERARPVTAMRTGRAKVDRIASNRRIIGPDGKSIGVRWTKCNDAALRAEPEGLIDPFLKTLSFWDGPDKLAALHYYAVHPTSIDRTGMVTCEFPGIARDRLAKREGVPHIYFTECAGDITPGKYNDGASDNRELFTQRILAAMEASEVDTVEHAVSEPLWKTVPVLLPPREDQPEEALATLIAKGDSAHLKRASRAAIILAFQKRMREGKAIPVGALHFGSAISLLHLPGEAFMEYQKYAQACAPDAFVAVPSYGDCGPGYITLARSFDEGGYEPSDSFCSGESEAMLKQAITEAMQH